MAQQIQIRYKQLLIVALFVWGIWQILAGKPAAAATYMVCPSGCTTVSLNHAISLASSGDTILFDGDSSSQVHHIEDNIVVDKNLTIGTTSGTAVRIQAADSEAAATDRVFHVLPNVTATIEGNIVVAYGRSATCGGGIFNEGHLTLVNIDVWSNNSNVDGGGICNSGTLILNNTKVFSNEAAGSGGGIFNSGDLYLFGVPEYDYVQSEYVYTELSWNTAGVQGGGLYNSQNLTIDQMYFYTNWVEVNTPNAAITHGGGGIYNEGVVTVSTALFRNNRAETDGSSGLTSHGGHLLNLGTFTLEDAILDSGTAQNRGGGIYHAGDGSLTVSNSEFTWNQADELGGGLYVGNSSTPVNLHKTYFRTNRAGDGGGLAAESNIDITNSTFNFNYTNGPDGGFNDGGAIYLWLQAEATITNSTISNNQADNGGGGLALFDQSKAYLANVTVTENTANNDLLNGGNGGGAFVTHQGQLRLKNSIIGGNSDLKSSILEDSAPDCAGTLTSDGYNLIGTLGTNAVFNPLCFVDTTNNLIGVSPDLDSMNYSLLVHGLLPNSPAINGGNPSGCTDYQANLLPYDQRGGLRRDRCDIGAYEVGAFTEFVFVPAVTK